MNTCLSCRLIALFAAGMLSGTAGLAQQPVRDASVDELVRQLAPTPAPTLTRGLQRNITPEKRQIDLVIPFDFDSAALQPASRPLLARLADAMKTERLAALRFKVEGHTDAKGSAAYNQDLSARRAAAVVAFLAAQGVAADRLTPEGKGFSEPLNGVAPAAAENRRVRIATLP